MTGGFSDYALAARLRDNITSIAEKTVARMRPEPRVGKVYDFNEASQSADILFAGENKTIKVRFATNLTPRRKMMDNPEGTAISDIVRVIGKPGNYYITDFVSGSPVHKVYEGSVNPPGVILPYGGIIAPLGYIWASGAFVEIATYSALFAVYGHRFNEGVDPGNGTFKLPDSSSRYLMGAGLSPVGSSDTEDEATRRQRLSHTHNHTTPNSVGNEGGHSHSAGSLVTSSHSFQRASDMTRTGTGVYLWDTAAGRTHNHNISGSTGSDGTHNHALPNTNNSSALELGNWHPRLTLNFIIKY